MSKEKPVARGSVKSEVKLNLPEKTQDDNMDDEVANVITT